MARKGFRPALVWNQEVASYLSQAFGSRLSKISEVLCCPPKSACIRVNTVKMTTEDVLPKLRAVAETASGGDGIEGPDRRQDYCWEHPQLKGVVIVEGSGPHEVDYADKAGFSLKNIVISRRCAESVLRGAQVFVPGVLACEAHVEEGNLVAVSVAIEREEADGSWHVGITRGTTLGSMHSSLQEGTTDSADRDRWHIGVGRALMSRASMFRESRGVAVEMVNRVFCLPSFNGVLDGLIFLQNLPSIVTVRVLDPQPGERILDMCASPGGKTTAIAIQMQDQGEVIACDRTHAKAMEVSKLAAEMGLTCIKAYKMDALKSVLPSPPSLPAPSDPLDHHHPINCSETTAHTAIDSAPLGACHLSHAPSSCSPAGSSNNSMADDATACSHLEAVSSGVRGLNFSRHGCVADERLHGRSQNEGSSTRCEAVGEGESSRLEYSASATLSEGGEDSQGAEHCLENGQRVGVDGGGISEEVGGKGKKAKQRRREKQVGARANQVVGFEPGSFDRVLLDAPCSALGLRPRLFAGDVRLQELRNHGQYQRRIFDRAVALVKPGGVIVYSTCTLNPGENEALVRYALDTYSSLSLVPQTPRLGGPGLVGGKDVFDGVGCREWLRDGEQDLVQRFDPSSDLDTIGFFIAKFRVDDMSTHCIG